MAHDAAHGEVAVPLQPMEGHGAAKIPLEPRKNLMWQKRDVTQGGCDPTGSLH